MHIFVNSLNGTPMLSSKDGTLDCSGPAGARDALLPGDRAILHGAQAILWTVKVLSSYRSHRKEVKQEYLRILRLRTLTVKPPTSLNGHGYSIDNGSWGTVR